MSTDMNRCNGVKADGSRCGATRMTNWAGKQSHLATPSPWFCHRHKAQDVVTERLRAAVRNPRADHEDA